MFKVRVLSAAGGIALLIAVMSLPGEVLQVAVFFIAVLGMHELCNALFKAGYKPIRPVGYISCLTLLLIGFLKPVIWLPFFIFLMILVVCSLSIFLHRAYNVVDISLTVFGVFYVVFLLSFITLTRNLQGGHIFVWMIFIGAWVPDTFAYFTGKAVGKRKLIPEVSPKKTVEGSIGAVVGCTAVMAAYGAFIAGYAGGHAPVYHYAAIGFLCGFISQIGDLSASAIKRFVGIKDYGNIMPGHGGVLDRFDSVLFVAPLIYFYVNIFML